MLNTRMSPCPCTFLLKIRCPGIVHQGALSGVEYYHLRFIVTEIKLFSALPPPPNSQPPISRCLFLFFSFNWYPGLLFTLRREGKKEAKRKHTLTPSLYPQITRFISIKHFRQLQEISESSFSG